MPSDRGEQRPPAASGNWVPFGWYGLLKRMVDLALATVGLVAMLPVLLVLMVMIRLDSPGPAIFRQRRIGRGSREFIIFKLRTMHLGTPEVVPPPSFGRGVTRVGRMLRRTSLDELPQLVNIIRGEMSIVGPRPALYNQDDLIELRRIAGVDRLRPGVTGMAQVEGRDDLDVPAKVALDVRYLERCSLAEDLRIMGRTVVALASGRGVN